MGLVELVLFTLTGDNVPLDVFFVDKTESDRTVDVLTILNGRYSPHCESSCR